MRRRKKSSFKALLLAGAAASVLIAGWGYMASRDGGLTLPFSDHPIDAAVPQEALPSVPGAETQDVPVVEPDDVKEKAESVGDAPVVEAATLPSVAKEASDLVQEAGAETVGADVVLGAINLSGRMGRPDPKEGASWIIRAADAGNPYGIYLRLRLIEEKMIDGGEAMILADSKRLGELLETAPLLRDRAAAVVARLALAGSGETHVDGEPARQPEVGSPVDAARDEQASTTDTPDFAAPQAVAPQVVAPEAPEIAANQQGNVSGDGLANGLVSEIEKHDAIAQPESKPAAAAGPESHAQPAESNAEAEKAEASSKFKSATIDFSRPQVNGRDPEQNEAAEPAPEVSAEAETDAPEPEQPKAVVKPERKVQEASKNATVEKKAETKKEEINPVAGKDESDATTAVDLKRAQEAGLKALRDKIARGEIVAVPADAAADVGEAGKPASAPQVPAPPQAQIQAPETQVAAVTPDRKPGLAEIGTQQDPAGLDAFKAMVAQAQAERGSEAQAPSQPAAASAGSMVNSKGEVLTEIPQPAVSAEALTQQLAMAGPSQAPAVPNATRGQVLVARGNDPEAMMKRVRQIQEENPDLMAGIEPNISQVKTEKGMTLVLGLLGFKSEAQMQAVCRLFGTKRCIVQE